MSTARAQLVEAPGEILEHRLAGFGPLHEHGEVVDPRLQLLAEIYFVFEPPPAFQPSDRLLDDRQVDHRRRHAEEHRQPPDQVVGAGRLERQPPSQTPRKPPT